MKEAEYLRAQVSCEHQVKGNGPGCGRRATHGWDMGVIPGRYFMALCDRHWLETAGRRFMRAIKR
jgi:hypothetical protein